MKEDRGCEQDSPIPGRWSIGDIVLNRCPLKSVDNRIYWYIKAYNFLEKGVLPTSGGWLDQSNKFIEAMNLITNEMEKIKRENHAK